MVYVEILVVVALIVLNGFFAMSELAIVSARKSRLKALARSRARGARSALALANEPGTFLPTVQIGITLIGVLAGAFSGATLADKLGDALDPSMPGYGDAVAIALVVAAITYLSLIVGELVPKRIALLNAEHIALRVARTLRLIARISSPAVWVLRVSSDFVLRLLRVRASAGATVTVEEVRAMVAEGAEAGVFERSEREIIERVLRLDDRSVRSVMTPRHEVVWLDVADGAAEVGRKIHDSGHSRFPLCKGSPDNVLGIVQTRDLLERALAGERFDLLAVVRRAPVFHETTTALEALELIRRSPVHIALVVDEYGSLQGITTVTDITEAIVGAIRETERPEVPAVVQRADGSWLVDGVLPIAEARHLLGIEDLPENAGFHTIAGFVMAELNRVPSEGDSLVWRDWRFEVVDMDGRRIDKVVMSRVEPNAAVLEP